MIALLAAAALAQSLPELQQRLATEREAAQKLAGREASVLGRLADLERQIELESRALRAAQVRLRAATQRLSVAEQRSQKAQGELDAATAVVEPRLVARYRLGREGYVRFLLGSKSIADLLQRRRFFNALLQADLDALALLRDARAGGKGRARRAGGRARRAGPEREDGGRAARLAAREGRSAADAARRRSSGRRSLHEQAVRELEDAEKQLTHKLAEIRRSHPALVAPEILLKASIRKARGKLPFPVERGKIEVPFGRAVGSRASGPSRCRPASTCGLPPARRCARCGTARWRTRAGSRDSATS